MVARTVVGAHRSVRRLMRLAPSDVLNARISNARSVLAARQLDALIVTNPSNIAYLTGFFASAAAAILSADRLLLIGDSRYAETLDMRLRECPLLQTVQLPSGRSYDDAIVEALVPLSAKDVGFEGSLTFSRHRYLAATLERPGSSTRLMECDGLVETLRAVKDPWEIGVLREGAARLSDVAKRILPNVLAGRIEAEVAGEIELELRRAGFERAAFDTIVASGPNAARPHGRAGARRIEHGDLVVVDFGGVLDGYCTDLSRTVTVGRAGRRERRVIDQVADAQDVAFATVAAGAPPESVDAAARSTLERHGLGDAFTHGTGHGLGLDVHEAPRVSRARPGQAESPLAAGMVLTLEPGAYFPGWGGVRIEDDVLVTDRGAEWLTDVPKVL